MINKTSFFLSLVACLLLTGAAVSAPKLNISEKQADQMTEIARKSITKAKLKDGSFVPAETETEKASPILPMADTKRVIEHGALASFKQQCGMEDKAEYPAFLKAEREKKVWSEKQMAYISVLHSVSKKVYNNYVTKNGGCTDKIKQFVMEKPAATVAQEASPQNNKR